jgi:group I intron endonuclease
MNVDYISNVSGIYRIENTVTGKFYIGSAAKLRSRLKSHRAALRRGGHYNNRLQSEWVKYGEAAFVAVVVEEVAKVHLLEVEQRHIDETRAIECGYNLSPTDGTTTGWVQPDHVRQAVAEANRIRVWTDEMRSRHSDALKGKASAETRERMSELGKSRAGRVVSEETREKLRIANLGKHHTEETRQKMSQYHRGHLMSEDQREKLREALKGRQFSEETRKKMSESAKRRWHKGDV